MVTNVGNSLTPLVEALQQTSSPHLMGDASLQINVGRPADAGITSQLAWLQVFGLSGY